MCVKFSCWVLFFWGGGGGGGGRGGGRLSHIASKFPSSLSPQHCDVTIICYIVSISIGNENGLNKINLN